jgi:hypothetical protein
MLLIYGGNGTMKKNMINGNVRCRIRQPYSKNTMLTAQPQIPIKMIVITEPSSPIVIKTIEKIRGTIPQILHENSPNRNP